ncbi:hypothetical protein [Mucilaginibacter defluvii]|uniref:Uncharacterized protein n=1 Tax=Mucilaginibacter defluvii TaxID=1196019 RepID=A0ABP9FTK1_9SPHI
MSHLTILDDISTDVKLHHTGEAFKLWTRKRVVFIADGYAEQQDCAPPGIDFLMIVHNLLATFKAFYLLYSASSSLEIPKE